MVIMSLNNPIIGELDELNSRNEGILSLLNQRRTGLVGHRPDNFPTPEVNLSPNDMRFIRDELFSFGGLIQRIASNSNSRYGNGLRESIQNLVNSQAGALQLIVSIEQGQIHASDHGMIIHAVTGIKEIILNTRAQVITLDSHIPANETLTDSVRENSNLFSTGGIHRGKLGIVLAIAGIIVTIGVGYYFYELQGNQNHPSIIVTNSSHTAVSFNQSGGIQSSDQSGGMIAYSITNNVINQGTSQSPNFALINIKDITNDGKIVLPIGINDKPYFESKLLLTGALPSDGVIYTKSIKFNLPHYNNSLFTLSTPLLVQQSIPPQPVQHGILNLTIAADMAEYSSTSIQYNNRNDLPRYEIQGGNVTFQFEYRSVQNNTQIIPFTDPLSIMVKGCIDEHNNDISCTEQQPYQSPQPVQESISVNTDKTSYNRGDTITIHGIVNSIIPNQFVIIQIHYHLGDLILSRSITPNMDGTYRYLVPLGSQFSDGEYIVTANYGSTQSQITFIVNRPTQP